jgi:exonuclease SbcD
MNIIHTADLHLKREADERIEVLQWLIQKAHELKADFFIIAGDLFESDADATILRTELKKIFEQAHTTFLIIPGNHDATSFSLNYDYGKNVIQLIQTPFEIIERGGIKVCAVPFQEKRFSECVRDIPNDIDIVIAHGTLYDESFIFSMLEDEETKYMPIYPTNLENVARYVALGHLHSRNIEKKYKNTTVVYPGSPIALDTKCENKRVFYYFNISASKITVEPMTIDVSPFWHVQEFFVFPGVENEVLMNVESFLKNVEDKNMMPSITIKGFIGEKDKIFKNHIEAIHSKFCEKFKNLRINSEIQAWDTIIQNRMVKTFVEKTMRFEEGLRMKIFEIAFPIFYEALK